MQLLRDNEISIFKRNMAPNGEYYNGNERITVGAMTEMLFNVLHTQAGEPQIQNSDSQENLVTSAGTSHIANVAFEGTNNTNSNNVIAGANQCQQIHANGNAKPSVRRRKSKVAPKRFVLANGENNISRGIFNPLPVSVNNSTPSVAATATANFDPATGLIGRGPPLLSRPSLPPPPPPLSSPSLPPPSIASFLTSYVPLSPASQQVLVNNLHALQQQIRATDILRFTNPIGPIGRRRVSAHNVRARTHTATSSNAASNNPIGRELIDSILQLQQASRTSDCENEPNLPPPAEDDDDIDLNGFDDIHLVERYGNVSMPPFNSNNNYDENGPSTSSMAVSQEQKQELPIDYTANSSSSGSPTHLDPDGVLMYECNRCPKSYRWKSTLRRHQSVECGGKAPSHQCPYCKYKSKQRGNLGVHVRKHHTELPQLPSKRRSKYSNRNVNGNGNGNGNGNDNSNGNGNGNGKDNGNGNGNYSDDSQNNSAASQPPNDDTTTN